MTNDALITEMQRVAAIIRDPSRSTKSLAVYLDAFQELYEEWKRRGITRGCEIVTEYP